MAKLGLTVIATIILLVHTEPIGRVAAFAAEKTFSGADMRQVRIQLIADASAALFALLVATTLSVYKPWGLTAYGRRDVTETRVLLGGTPSAFWRAIWIVGIIVVITLFVILHLATGGLGHH